MNPRRAQASVLGLLLVSLLLSGCPRDVVPDLYVYFVNNTDKVVTPIPRHLTKAGPDYVWIQPHTTEAIRVVGVRDCRDDMKVIDQEGNVVMELGKICWHETVTIP